MSKPNKYIFDLDNTLIYTDLLNNDAYNYALKLQGLEAIGDCRRITRDYVFNKYLNIGKMQETKIIELKQGYFINNMQSTILNTQLLRILETENIENCVLWTSADRLRAKALLEYYNMSNSFKEILFSEKINVSQDIEKICRIFECDMEQLVFYEDNRKVIEQLQDLKINVVSVELPYIKNSINNVI